ncbi:MAG: uracil-DNA glycosylase [Acidobacteria bacterium]|nr:uracil-DNA glycosylase [Acidobacteriota bacterium]
MKDAVEYLRFLREIGVETVPRPLAIQLKNALETSPSPESPSVKGVELDVVARFDEMAAEVLSCEKCGLRKTRNKPVFGEGDLHTDLMFIGEGPGRDEDQQGIPFVGRAGQLLTKIINAIELDRKDVYITNIVKCRPPGNRDPLPEEAEACHPYLAEQIRLIQPKVICTLGRHASQVILNTTESISRLRNRFHKINGIMVMPTYHPAYLLRNASGKRPVWEDMQKIRDFLKENSDMYQRSRYGRDTGSR